MHFETLPSPARVSAASASALPRAAFFGLLFAYIVAGLIGRDPWYADDLAGFGTMWTMARGTAADWWLPNIAGEGFHQEGPLAFWLGAAFMRLGGPLLGDPMAARLACVAWFALATTSLWYAAYRLARRDEAQPVAFVFGGGATPRDYARLIADVAVLLLLGTLGVVLRLHETTIEGAALAVVCSLLFAIAYTVERPVAGALLAGVAVGALALARGPLPAALALAATCAVFAIQFATDGRRVRWRLAALAAAAAVATWSLWPLAALAAPAAARAEYFSSWLLWVQFSVGLPTWDELAWSARNMLWYMWPLWPLAAWSIYAWRHGLTRVHILAPAALAAAMFATLLSGEQASRTYLSLMVPPFVLLAAFGATTLRRSAENALDWFAILTYSFFALVIWAYWFATQTGTPPKMAASVARLVPGFSLDARWPTTLLAAAATAGWIALVGWRITRLPAALWRGPALAAAGLTMLWLVGLALFQPAIDYNRSYAALARQVAERVRQFGGPEACVESHRLLPAHRAAFAYHGELRFGSGDAGRLCPLTLHRDTLRSELDNDPPPGDWQEVWETRWAARPEEVIRLYRRAAP
jgi:4-amino-4-deoxy-L-arabinose transferase-like glycosyltransferase